MYDDFFNPTNFCLSRSNIFIAPLRLNGLNYLTFMPITRVFHRHDWTENLFSTASLCSTHRTFSTSAFFCANTNKNVTFWHYER